MRYEPVFSDSAVVFFASVTRRRQRRLLDRARELADDPFLMPDFSSVDEDGRKIRHVLADDFLFSYWPDHAAQVVMIVDIEDAE